MRVGVDWRAWTALPHSGIGRQVQALHQALAARPDTEAIGFSAAPLDHPHRRLARCPARPSPLDGLHRLGQRWAFERRFLPQAVVEAGLDVYIATVNMGLPLSWKRPPARPRLVLLLHDLFQVTHRNAHASPLRAAFYGVTDQLSIAYSLRRADVIWTPSARTAEAAALLFPATRERLRVLPNAVPFAHWQVDEAPAGSPPAGLPAAYWLLVGAREPRKNIPWFLQAWQQARQQARQPTDVPPLVIVAGPDDVKDPPPGVVVLSQLDEAALRRVYRGALRLWHPSYAEGFGLPVVEACACGVPVATALGSALDEVTPPRAPRFDPFDGAALVHTLIEVARRDLADGARAPGESVDELQAWARHYDLDAYARRLDALLKELA